MVLNPQDTSLAAAGNRQPQLNINRQITALATGPLMPKSIRDVLLIGTQNFLQCYDVDQNKDIFFKDIPDGISCLVVGSCGSHSQPLVLVGGNCSVQGYNSMGTEVMWTVTGGNVTALALADVDDDQQNELLVGSDDADIRIYKDEDLILQIAEADVVVALAAIEGRRFAYALRNGTIGVYEGSTRLWRVKSKHSVSALTTFDLDGDGRLELISGWSNGKVEARNCSTGDVVGRDGMSSGVAGLMTGPLRDAQGEAELLAVSTDGDVRGYVMRHPDTVAEVADVSLQQQMLVELAQKKQALTYELSSYQAKGNKSSTSGHHPAAISSVVPPNTRVDSCITLNRENQTCELVLKTNNDSVIKAAVLFGEQVFLNESLFVRPAQPGSSLSVPLSPARDMPVVLMMKVLVGSKTSSVYHVFELEMEVPKYAMYAAEERPPPGGPPSSCVSCILQHPISRLQGWVETRFNTQNCISPSASSLEAHFTCIRTRQPLAVRAAAGASGLKVWLHSHSMELAGELLQDLAAYLGIEELSTTAHFPAIMETFQATLKHVEACSATRMQVEGATAAQCSAIKTAVVRAEDARLLVDMTALKRHHRRLADLNRDMWLDHAKRANNQRQLLDGLRTINQMIQAAAKLRVGPAQARVVTACRAAIRVNNLQALNKVVCEGAAAPGGAL
eukprot:gene10207-10368_t